ncbi:MAG: type II toxin-antitoxin system VapC family toxin [Cyanobacteria bacterium K_DeepCast_35m_m2_023]|nr:type II toxin-antitoxin system VapC family toxin [Cyanobacteria bacterium K_DeepCast_35m_m2_023]
MQNVDEQLWVVDASVAFGWFACCQQSEKAVELLERTQTVQRISPDLVLIELLNAGWTTHRAGAITDEQLQAMTSLTPKLLGAVVPTDHALLQTALAWCRRLDHPAYDCLYMALAEQRNGTLVTADRRLLKALSRAEAGSSIAVDLAAWSMP